jgi:hypothetical protein
MDIFLRLGDRKSDVYTEAREGKLYRGEGI